jgi:hypothetical protein
MPSGLSDEQRSVLSEFFAGHISAGQLSKHLALARPETEPCAAADADPSVFPPADHSGKQSTPTLRVKSRTRIWLIAVVVVCAAGAAVGAVLGSQGVTVGRARGAAGQGRAPARGNAVVRAHHHRRSAPGRTTTQQSTSALTGRHVPLDAPAPPPSTTAGTKPARNTRRTITWTSGRTREQTATAITAPVRTTLPSITIRPATPTTTITTITATNTTVAPSTPAGAPRRHHRNGASTSSSKP